MSLLDRKLRTVTQVALIAFMALLPARYVLKRFSTETGFSSLIYFGSEFLKKALPEVRSLAPPTNSPWGYDGQFYAQVAMDPLLLKPELKQALDTPAYRATRILLPASAYLAGLGRPFWILQCYAVVNLFFWYLLLCGMVYYLRPTTLRDYLCVGASCLTSGVLFSIQRALPDLPAATFSFYSAALSSEFAVAALAMAILTKDFYVVSMAGAVWSSPGAGDRLGRLLLRFAGALLPFVTWYLYVHCTWGFSKEGQENFSWPLAGYTAAFMRGWALIHQHRTLFSFTEMAAPVSLVIQTIYLLCVSRSYRSAYWRIGAGFAVASLFLSSTVFVEQMGFCRNTILITLAFNICLMQNKPRLFLPWFLAGNLGLTWGLMQFISG